MGIHGQTACQLGSAKQAHFRSKQTQKIGHCKKMAEAQGFEPWGRFHARRFSRPVHSTTLPNLRNSFVLIPPPRFGKQAIA